MISEIKSNFSWPLASFAFKMRFGNDGSHDVLHVTVEISEDMLIIIIMCILVFDNSPLISTG